MARSTPPALPLLGAALLSACASWGEVADGPFFQAGVTDGCRTAKARNASFSTDVYKDEQLFRAEESYRGGWRSGYAQCQPLADPTGRPEDLGQQDLGFGE